MIKKTIIAIFSAAVIFAAGWFSGQCYHTKLFATSELRSSTADLAGLLLKIEELDKKNYESVKKHINIDIDANILTISSLLTDSSSKHDVENAKKFLSHVAKHRKQFPASYAPNITDPNHDENHRTIEAILNQYVSYKP